eukprot:scaffold25950_cov27-Tisochrysis_lutea.AAC.3
MFWVSQLASGTCGAAYCGRCACCNLGSSDGGIIGLSGLDIDQHPDQASAMREIKAWEIGIGLIVLI